MHRAPLRGIHTLVFIAAQRKVNVCVSQDQNNLLIQRNVYWYALGISSFAGFILRLSVVD